MKKCSKLLHGIGVKLVGAFCIPIFFIFLIGMVSTQKASEVIVSSYQESTMNTVLKTAEYYEVLLQGMDAKSRSLASDRNIRSYYEGTYQTVPTKESEIATFVKSTLRNISESEEAIASVHIISDYGQSFTGEGTIINPRYQEFIKEQEGVTILESEEGIWYGNHPILDEIAGSVQEEYGIGVSRKIISNQLQPVAVVTVDVSNKSLQKPLQSISLPEGSICALVTDDGREITIQDTKIVFSTQDFFRKAKENDELNGMEEILFQGEQYLFMYAKTSPANAMVASIIPKSALIQKAAGIEKLTKTFTILAIIFAMFAGTVITIYISRSISKMSRFVSETSEGKLTGEIKLKQKDEFGFLAGHLNTMVASMKQLIGRVKEVVVGLLNSSGRVSTASGQFLETAKEIAQAIEKMSGDLEIQSSDTQKCLTKMNELDDKVSNVYQQTSTMLQNANETGVVVETGIQSVGKLRNNAEETVAITKLVVDNIKKLEMESKAIAGFTETINGIATQTNLLSLNASIEAARAGEAGRGFSVVADEIRKLADASLKASKEIEKVIRNINLVTKDTVTVADKAENIVSTQVEEISNAVDVFEDITGRVGRLTNSIGGIGEQIEEIEAAKNITMQAITNINDLIAQNASGIQQIQASAHNQDEAAYELKKEVEKLTARADELETAVKCFHV